MNNNLKAKIIVELLDERKYSVLSSFSSTELNKLNAIGLEELDQLSASEINNTLTEFLKNTDKRLESGGSENIVDAPAVDVPKMKTKKKSKKSVSSISEKLSEQPPQLLACLLNKVDEDNKKLILDNISKEQKALIESIQVDANPIFDTVVSTILEELELTSAS